MNSVHVRWPLAPAAAAAVISTPPRTRRSSRRAGDTLPPWARGGFDPFEFNLPALTNLAVSIYFYT
jgi:hypothetical protein